MFIYWLFTLKFLYRAGVYYQHYNLPIDTVLSVGHKTGTNLRPRNLVLMRYGDI